MRLLRPNRIVWMALGAAGAYYFDPDNGPARRAMLRDKVSAKRQEMESDQSSTPFSSESQLESTAAPSPYQSPAPSSVGAPGDGSASRTSAD
jgi:hypothetical protein